jgi:hypothetical protein
MGIFQPFQMLLPLCDGVSQGRPFLENDLGFVLILPEVICGGQRVEFRGANFFTGDVKDASRAFPSAGLNQ